MQTLETALAEAAAYFAAHGDTLRESRLPAARAHLADPEAVINTRVRDQHPEGRAHLEKIAILELAVELAEAKGEAD
jgi:hypothetical protein